jgi:hypothetical protein
MEMQSTKESYRLRPAAQASAPSRAGLRFLGLHNVHGNRCYPANDGRICRVPDMLGAAVRLLGGNEDEFSCVHFAPRADVTVTKFDEENRTVMVCAPSHQGNFLLPGIDSDKGSWSHNWVERVIVSTDIVRNRKSSIYYQPIQIAMAAFEFLTPDEKNVKDRQEPSETAASGGTRNP